MRFLVSDHDAIAQTVGGEAVMSIDGNGSLVVADRPQREPLDLRALREDSSHQTLPNAQITRLSSTSMRRKCVVSRSKKATSCQPRPCDRALLAEPLPSRWVIACSICRERRRLAFSCLSPLPLEAFLRANIEGTKPEAPGLRPAPTAGAGSKVIPGSSIEAPCEGQNRLMSAANGRRHDSIATTPSNNFVQLREKSLVRAKLRRPH